MAASKYWPLGTWLRAKRRVVPTKQPLQISGVYTSEGKIPMGTITYIETGSIYEVSNWGQPLHLKRVPKPSDAGEIVLVIEMEDPNDWEPY